eukprot:15365263-Ditylum_brightwellii.AAC.2
MSGEHQLMYWSLSFKRVESRFLSGHPGVEKDCLWNSVNHTSISCRFDDTFISVHSDNQEDPNTWEKLITSSSAWLKVTLDSNEYPELDDERGQREKYWPKILSNAKRHLEILEPHHIDMERLPLQNHL